MDICRPIGIFDSGFGGLTVLKEIERALPEFDFLYLGDNARTPYGNRSFETVYIYTLEAVTWLFSKGCPLVILACNTASAKALRTIQQTDLLRIAPSRRILGVIRPVTERAGDFTKSGHIGILGTTGTVSSQSYVIEISKYFPEVVVTQEACPMWVPLVENGEADGDGTDYFIQQHIERLLSRDREIDTVFLGCTHYPILEQKIRKWLPHTIATVSQGPIVAQSLSRYLKRHHDIEKQCTRKGRRLFFTTEKSSVFEMSAAIFYGKPVQCREVSFQDTCSATV